LTILAWRFSTVDDWGQATILTGDDSPVDDSRLAADEVVEAGGFIALPPGRSTIGA
jgi:hypothetical protein